MKARAKNLVNALVGFSLLLSSAVAVSQPRVAGKAKASYSAQTKKPKAAPAKKATTQPKPDARNLHLSKYAEG